jgi:hypothetical protein
MRRMTQLVCSAFFQLFQINPVERSSYLRISISLKEIGKVNSLVFFIAQYSVDTSGCSLSSIFQFSPRPPLFLPSFSLLLSFLFKLQSPFALQ